MVAGFDGGDGAAYPFHDSCDFVAEDEGQGKVVGSLLHGPVGVADTGGCDADEDFVGGGLGDSDVLDH